MIVISICCNAVTMSRIHKVKYYKFQDSINSFAQNVLQIYFQIKVSDVSAHIGKNKGETFQILKNSISQLHQQQYVVIKIIFSLYKEKKNYHFKFMAYAYM
jgi:hypothetical protein